MNKNEIEVDIWEWIKGYIEVNHKFYDYKFPPCPYAKSARLKGLVDVQAYSTGSVYNFLKIQAAKNTESNKHSVMVLVLPPRIKYYPLFSWFIKKLNKKLITKNYYAQHGTALTTESKYKGFFNSGEYSIVIINKLSEILDGHQSLLKTDYYKPWASDHYTAVVERRQQMYEKYKNK
jgi:hypothetical protein